MKGNFTVSESFVRDMIDLAIKHNKQIKIAYTSKSGESNYRIVEPIEDAGQNFLAWCQKRDNFRHFSYDRVARIVVTDYDRTKELEEES